MLACGGEGTGGGSAETVRVERRTFASTLTAIGSVQPQIGAEVRVGARLIKNLIGASVSSRRHEIGLRRAAGLGLLGSIALGLAVGVIPAIRAARLDPITALRRS